MLNEVAGFFSRFLGTESRKSHFVEVPMTVPIVELSKPEWKIIVYHVFSGCMIQPLYQIRMDCICQVLPAT